MKWWSMMGMRLRLSRRIISFMTPASRFRAGNAGGLLRMRHSFTFRNSGPLDMRIGPDAPTTAGEIVNNASERDLSKILAEGGVRAGRKEICRAILRSRPIENTAQLAQIIREALLPVVRKERKKGAEKSRADLATVPFQAIRIGVNREFEAIKQLCDAIPQILAPGGKLAIITFHSLEDQLVTSALRRHGRDEMVPRRGIILKQAIGKLHTPQAITPSEAEIEQNSRARSARLRLFERFTAADQRITEEG